ncbi:MAG TPA: methyltransferase domain-containing protein [Rhizomicrobium sp.]|nr:methyltransferase domain-containing protein [Rhizomicrobium sp.]
MLTALESPACAVCRGSSHEIVQTQSLALLGKNMPCEIRFGACRRCGHLQQWPPVSPEVMAHHYQTFATYELFGAPAELRVASPSRHTRRFLSLAQDLGLAPGRAYEIGCASGEMLNQFRRERWQVRGCAPSPSAISQARTIFDIVVDLGSEENTIPHQKDLDLILMCHVLEHLYDPAATLSRCYDALVPQGHLLLEVPCAIAPDTLLPGWFSFEHLHYYRMDVLEWLLNQAGFEIIELRIAMKVQHYPVIAIAARKTSRKISTGINMDTAASITMARRYVKRDTSLWSSTESRLSDIRGSIFLYGAGIHTAQLLDNTNLAEHADIIAIADRDSKKWGQRLASFPVIGPEELLRHPQKAPIVISSYVSEQAIVRALLDRGVQPARIRTLYTDLAAIT